MDYTATMEVEDGLRLFYPHQRTGILGGTFNPVHNGHIDMALNIRREFDLESVVLVPTGNPPHKREEQDLAPAQARLQMAALCALECAGLRVSDIEVKREGYSYTVDTMRELTDKYKDTDFYFIIGSDSLFELESWKEIAALCRLTKFVCVRRQEHDKLAVAAEAARLAEKYEAEILISQLSGLYVSSSYIRKRIAEGKSIADFVPAAVEEYIDASGLYK